MAVFEPSRRLKDPLPNPYEEDLAGSASMTQRQVNTSMLACSQCQCSQSGAHAIVSRAILAQTPARSSGLSNTMRVRPLDVSKGLAGSKTKIRSQMQAWHLVWRLFLHVSWPPPRQLASSKALQRSSEDLSNPKFRFGPRPLGAAGRRARLRRGAPGPSAGGRAPADSAGPPRAFGAGSHTVGA